jgi:hypothetical protein
MAYGIGANGKLAGPLGQAINSSSSNCSNFVLLVNLFRLPLQHKHLEPQFSCQLVPFPSCKLMLASPSSQHPFRQVLPSVKPGQSAALTQPLLFRLVYADVANAFATSVGSRTLKLKWAIVIAVVSVQA